jgi:rSAM/selenodomain-associated transferase 2
MSLSIILPVLNEAENIQRCLAPLQALRASGHEVIVVDGGSTDTTAAIAATLADRVIPSPRGRAAQMNAGAAIAKNATLLFLHADCTLPAYAAELIERGLAESGMTWGRFDVALDGQPFMLHVVAWFMNRRSRLTGIATGDQGMFVQRKIFQAIGGFPPIVLMEDIAMSQLLKRQSPALCLHERIICSSRRWEQHGIWRTIFLMWRLRLAYFFGADPQRLARRYDG